MGSDLTPFAFPPWEVGVAGETALRRGPLLGLGVFFVRMHIEPKYAFGETLCLASFLETAAGQGVMREHHGKSKNRPRCMCTAAGVPMQIIRRADSFFLGRMPGTGLLHANSCPNNEDVNLFSGVGCYSPAALQASVSGEWQVLLDLATTPGRPTPTMSLNGMFDLLIEHAGINTYNAQMPRPRGWGHLRASLRQAAQHMQLHGMGRLIDLMLVPETFRKEASTSLHEANTDFLTSGGIRFVCSLLRDVSASTYSHLITLKHLPDLRFWVSPALVSQIPLGERENHEGGYLILCLVDQGRKSGNHQVRALACRRLGPRYVLSGNPKEDAAMEQFISQQQSFFKPLRFDSPPEIPLADFVITTAEPYRPVFIFDEAESAHTGNYAKRLVANALKQI